MIIELPELETREVSLEPVQRTTRGGGRVLDAESVEQRVRLGGPVFFAITSDDNDAELRRALEAEANLFRYYFLRLACTFQPGPGESFDKAWVQIELVNRDATATQEAIAWSMTPERIVKPVKLPSGVKVGASVKIVSAEVSGGAEVELEQPWLLALNLLRSDPTWEFSKTSGTGLTGSQDMVMVVRAPAASSVEGRLRLRASLKRNGPLSIIYRALFEGESDVHTFMLRP